MDGLALPVVQRFGQSLCETVTTGEIPFLKARLAPENFAEPRGPVTGLSLVAPEPETVRHLFAGRLGPIGLDVDSGERPEVAAIHFGDGSSLGAEDLV